METFIQENLAEKEYEILYRELHSIPPPPDGGSYSISGIQLWLLTSPMRSWMELAWGLYRGRLDNALKQARLEIIQDEGEGRIYTILRYFKVSNVIIQSWIGLINPSIIPEVLYYGNHLNTHVGAHCGCRPKSTLL